MRHEVSVGSMIQESDSPGLPNSPERPRAGDSPWRVYADRWPAALKEISLERGADLQLLNEQA